jgi:hypothetical protein
LDIRPTVLAVTSLDGTRATTYKVVTLVPVCDNSLEYAMGSAASGIKIKHSARSVGKLNDVRGALGLIYKNGEEMTRWLDSLAKIDVPDAVMWNLVCELVTMPDQKVKVEDGKSKVTNQRAITMAENKRSDLMTMWNSDPRCNRWNGTLLGAYQTVNTWNEHERSNNNNQVERIMTGTLDGTFKKADEEFWAIVSGVSEDGAIDLRPMAEVLLATAD